MKQSRVVGLDIGTSQVTAVIAEIKADARPEVMGLGVAPSRGLRKGVVVNPEAAADPIRRSVEDAERMSGLEAESVIVSLSGTSLRGLNNRGVIAITNRDRHITRTDIQRVIETACLIPLPGGHEIVDVQPQEYLVDGQEGITDPLGMVGTRLEVSAHILTGPMAVQQNVITAVNRAGLLVAGVVLEPMAAAEAVLTPDEQEYGAVAINIGSETTSLAVCQRGAVQHTAIFPLGGSHFTNDLAIGVRTPMPEAERIKRDHGSVLSSVAVSDYHSAIEVPSFSQRPPRTLSLEVLCDILQPRAEEIFNQVHDELRRFGFDRQLSSGVVLTGGGALLRGLPELAEQMFDCPARLGYPINVGGMTEEINHPLRATAIGLVQVAARRGGLSSSDVRSSQEGPLAARAAARMKNWFGGLF